jgi:hypothetical protein
MDTKKQNIHYCTILSSEQWIFLLEGKSSVNRYKCLYRLMSEAVRTKTVYKIKGIEIALEVGQVATSDVELAEYLGCNRKTIGKLIDSFNRLGMLTTKTNNRTSVHTLHFLTGWYVDGVLVTNPHYVRPSATAKGQTGDIRTPATDTSFSFGGQCNEQEADSTKCDTFPLSSSLCSSETPDLPPPNFFDEEETDNPHIIDYGDRPLDSIPTESHKKAQDGTDGDEVTPA